MTIVIVICLAIITCVFLVVGIYFISFISSAKKTLVEFEELVSLLKTELPNIEECKECIKGVKSVIDEITTTKDIVKTKIITPAAFILGIFAGIKAILNILLKGGEKNE